MKTAHQLDKMINEHWEYTKMIITLHSPTAYTPPLEDWYKIFFKEGYAGKPKNICLSGASERGIKIANAAFDHGKKHRERDEVLDKLGELLFLGPISDIDLGEASAIIGRLRE